MATFDNQPVVTAMPGEGGSSPHLAMNGKSQKKRLENILFKLKKSDNDNGSPCGTPNPMSPEEACSQDQDQLSSGNNSLNASPGPLSWAEGSSGNVSSKRKSSRKPSKREQSWGGVDDSTNDGLDESYASQQMEEDEEGGEAEDSYRDSAGSNDEGGVDLMKVKMERDDAHDYPNVFSNITAATPSEMFAQSQAEELESSQPDMFPCPKCSSVFPSPDELDMHVNTTHGQPEARDSDFSVHPCYICGRSYASQVFLFRHIVSHDENATELTPNDPDPGLWDDEPDPDPTEGYHKCYRCRRVFPTDDALQTHKCRRGLIRPYGCGRCGRCYTHFQNLTNHLQLHEDGLAPDLECHECGQRFMYSIELRRHVTIHIKADFTPMPSSRLPVMSTAPTSTFTSSSSHSQNPSLGGGSNNSSSTYPLSGGGGGGSGAGGSNDPMKLRLPLSRFLPAKRRSKKRGTPKANPCEVCGKVFYQRSYLTMHMKVHNEKQYQCEVCNKKFTFKKSLEIHTRSHTGEKPYNCTVCSKDFTRQDSLHKHLKMHSGVKPFVCELCGRQFGDKFELQRHSLSHSQEKPHKCNICHKAYNDKKRLKEHMFTHSGSLPYECDLCGKGFARKYRYQQHLDQHAGEVRFFCEECGKGFYRRSDLNSHRETHSGKRPFKCQTCGMGFLRESYLRRHMIVHSETKPYSCPECGKEFARKNTLRRHLQTHGERKEGDEEFAEINERYTKLSGGELEYSEVAPLQVTNDEERDIMKDIQAVIGLGADVNLFD